MPNFPGIVMDRSGSGNSVYMEPYALVALNNEHAVCCEAENAEERRILHKLTERVMERAGAIKDAERALGQIDLFYALSEKIRRDKWRMPALTGASRFDFKRARHPLLKESAVPIDISCGEDFRILVITGPNTGGKTVALKTAVLRTVAFKMDALTTDARSNSANADMGMGTGTKAAGKTGRRAGKPLLLRAEKTARKGRSAKSAPNKRITPRPPRRT
jgi:dsDNA-specific endonuclease/ATPase MutS2